jgi:hypothetical protein
MNETVWCLRYGLGWVDVFRFHMKTDGIGFMWLVIEIFSRERS